MPQRMIPNEYLAMLEKASPLKRLRIALQSWRCAGRRRPA
jgi:hypothetical protein